MLFLGLILKLIIGLKFLNICFCHFMMCKIGHVILEFTQPYMRNVHHFKQDLRKAMFASAACSFQKDARIKN